jgi:aminoglycoside phosphotransferase (APT) family kinase protein
VADTVKLRARYGVLVDGERRRIVDRWCDWIDHILARSPGEVVVHGDFHGFNQLWDFDRCELVAVLDLEECGLVDLHFDFRYLPGNSDTTALVLAVVDAYERRSGLALELDRIMAWHILTVLGDALWRTEAGVALPGGGDACSYVDDVQRRLETLDIAVR